MIKIRKKFIKIYYVAMLVIGFLFGVFSAKYNIPKIWAVFIFTIFAGFAGLGMFIYLTLWNKKFASKSAQILDVLYKEKNPEKYIEKMKNFIPEKSGRFFDDMRDINITAGYYYMHDYQKCEQLLENINKKKLPKNLSKVYYINLALTKFQLGKKEEFIKIIENNPKCFDENTSTKNTYNLPSSIAIARCFYLLEKGENEKAREKIIKTVEKYVGEYNQNDIDNLKGKI